MYFIDDVFFEYISAKSCTTQTETSFLAFFSDAHYFRMVVQAPGAECHREGEGGAGRTWGAEPGNHRTVRALPRIE